MRVTMAEAKRKVYRKCSNCKFWLCPVWVDGAPGDTDGTCAKHGCCYKDGEEECCRSFDYALWAVKKAMRELTGGVA